MSIFLLVHGGAHGGWCWARLIPELLALGHRSVTVDLPADDPQGTWGRYERLVLRAVEGVDDLVVVGHSLGGYVLPLVASRRPVRRLIYLCANIPEPGKGIRSQLAEHPGMITLPRGEVAFDESGRMVISPDGARAAFFHDLADPGTVEWAVSRLRPQALLPYDTPYPLDALPCTPVTYILQRGDRALDPAWSREHARRLLGVDPIERDGGHSPYLSEPAALARLLVAEAARPDG